jgi:hypothetical protein
LHGLQRRVETQRLDVDGEALVLGDVPEEIHVDADEIALCVLEFERGEGRVGGYDVVLAVRRRGRGGQQPRSEKAYEDGCDQRRQPMSRSPHSSASETP